MINISLNDITIMNEHTFLNAFIIKIQYHMKTENFNHKNIFTYISERE